MARQIPDDPMFDAGGRPRCEDCAAHHSSAEGRAASRLFILVYRLAGYVPTMEHPDGWHPSMPDELNLKGAYYAAYHDREHVAYAELGLEETPTR